MRYLICTVEEYNSGVADGVKLDDEVKVHSPIYNQFMTMVLVKGIGDLTLEQVKKYQEDNDWYKEEL